MKKVFTISTIFFLLVYSGNIVAQTENFLDTLIMETDSFIRIFNDSPKISKIKKCRFSTKTITNITYEGIYYRLNQRIKYKNGFKIEKSKIKYQTFGKHYNLLNVVLINDEYIYIKRTKYVKGNWKQIQSVEIFGNGNTYSKFDSESGANYLCTFRR